MGPDVILLLKSSPDRYSMPIFIYFYLHLLNAILFLQYVNPGLLTADEIEEDIALITGVKRQKGDGTGGGVGVRRSGSSSSIYVYPSSTATNGHAHHRSSGAISASGSTSGLSAAVMARLEADVRRLQTGLHTCRGEISSVNTSTCLVSCFLISIAY